MRILFWSELFWPYAGGPEILGSELLRALSGRGYEFAVVTSHDHLELPGEADYYGIPVYRFPFRAALANADVRKLRKARQDVARLKRAFAPDIIHMNAIGPSVLFHLQTADVVQAPVLVTLHTLYRELEHARIAGRETLLDRALDSASWVTCVSAAVLNDASSRMPEIKARSSVIYNGLTERNISLSPLPFAPIRLLCLGRLVPAKGFDLALFAFSLVIDSFPHARLVIAGDGPMRPHLQAQASRLGLADSVEFTGWVVPEKVPRLINTATLVLMPSRREGLPLVGIQAAQMARPVVGTCAGGLPELVVHEKTGLIVEKENSAALGEAIIFLLCNPALAEKMGKAARRRAEGIFGLQRCIDAYDFLYRRIGSEVSYANIV